MQDHIMKWEEIRSVFKEDEGTLRDIYVLDTDINDWQCLLDFLRSGDYLYRFDSKKGALLPEKAKDVLANWEDWLPFLTIIVGGLELNCLFAEGDEIEFWLDPIKVQSEREAEALFEFMRDIGQTLKKTVRLTPEAGRNYALVEYSPETDLIMKKNDYY
jgi:hypothetical protein